MAAARFSWRSAVRRTLLALVLLFIYFAFIRRPPPQPEPPRVQLPPSYFHQYDPTKVTLHIGPRRFNVIAEYVMMQPFVGGDFQLLLVWPSMRSIDEEVAAYGAKVDGKPGVRNSDLIEILFGKVPSPERYTDDYKSLSKPAGPYPTERVDELGLYVRRTAGLDYFWAMDPAVVTPMQKVPYAFSCSRAKAGLRETNATCSGSFQLHPEVSIRIHFTRTQLKHWKQMYFKTLEFIDSIEEKR